MRAAFAAAVVILAAAAVPAAVGRHPTRARDCSHQSSASFPGAYASARNLGSGRWCWSGAARYSSPETVREFGG